MEDIATISSQAHVRPHPNSSKPRFGFGSLALEASLVFKAHNSVVEGMLAEMADH